MEDEQVKAQFPTPFKTSYLEGERPDEKRETINISINAEERVKLDLLKAQFNTKSDGTALKKAAWIGLNATQALLGSDFLPWATSSKRRKQDD